MKMKTGLLGSAVLIAFTMVAACGGSDEGGKGNGGKGGSGGKGGTAGGGSSSGGSSSGGTASGGKGGSGGTNSSTGGTTSGGTGTNVGGFPIGMGGAFNPDDYVCDPVPEDGSACEAGTLPCATEEVACVCMSNEWSCYDLSGAGGTGPIGNIDCPADKPMNGAACGASIGFCPYGNGANMGCACFQSKWNCTP
jgi:hypothetical protein